MKNEFQKHKKSDSVKRGIAFTLIAILLITAVLGILQAFTDFKPSEWFTGNIEGTPSSEEMPECEHVFDHGVCTKCGDRVEDVITMATKVISPDEECTVNYWTHDYQLIKTEKALGGDNFVGLEGYENYFFLSSNELNVNSYDGVENGNVLVNGEFFDISAYVGSSLCSFYPVFDNSSDKNSIKLLAGDSFTIRYNGKLLGGNKSAFVNPIFPEFHDIFEFNERPYVFLNEGDELELLSFNYGGIYFSMDGFCFNAFQSGYEVSYGLDTVNVIVIGYEEDPTPEHVNDSVVA